MKNTINEIKKINTTNKIILISIFGIVLYLLINSIISYYSFLKVEEDIKNLKFNVKVSHFENGYSIRTAFDNVLIIDLVDPINQYQFSKMTFTIPNEAVEAKLVNEYQIRIELKTPFIKSKQSFLQVRFYNTLVYTFNYSSSEVDLDYFKNRIPDKSPLDF